MRKSKAPVGQMRDVPGVGRVILHSTNRDGYPIFKKATDPSYFGTLCVGGEKALAIAHAFGLPAPKATIHQEK